MIDVDIVEPDGGLAQADLARAGGGNIYVPPKQHVRAAGLEDANGLAHDLPRSPLESL